MSGILLSSSVTPHLSKQGLSLDLELGDCARLTPQGHHCIWPPTRCCTSKLQSSCLQCEHFTNRASQTQPSTLTSSSHPSPEDCPTFSNSNFPLLLWHVTIFPIHYHLKYAHVNVILCLFPHPLSTLHAFSAHHSHWWPPTVIKANPLIPRPLVVSACQTAPRTPFLLLLPFFSSIRLV